MTGFLTAEHTGENLLRLEPPRATLGQLQLTNRLEMVRVDSDVLGVVEHLKRIDPGLVLMYDQGQQVFVLYWQGRRADEHGIISEHEDLIGAYTELDQRLIRLVERIDAQGRGRTDLAVELDKLEREKDREEEQRQSETMGPIAEQLRYALRKDLGAEGSSVHMSGGRGGHRARRERRRRSKRT